MRKQTVVQVPAEWGGRDAPGGRGKLFLLTEWPAAVAEEWGVRALLAYNRGGGDVPNIAGLGMEGIFFVGVQTFLRGQMQAAEVVPILNELFDCVQIIRDPDARDPATGDPLATKLVGEDDIEEVRTRMWLRSEVVKLHTGFSPADAVSTLISMIMTKKTADSQSTRTSPD